MTFTPLIGSLAYLWDQRRDDVLMVKRNARPTDDHFGKMNGLGGKLEQDESVVDCLRREISEESGLTITSFQLRGTITWSNFGPKLEPWLAFIFLVDGWSGTPPTENEEGDLVWVPRPVLLDACVNPDETDIPLWAGDRHFIPLVFDEDQRCFHGTMPYENDKPLSWEYERI